MPRPIVVRHDFKKRNKFNVSAKDKRTADGITFDSQLEMRVYQRIKREEETGQILFFLRQAPFHLPGGIRYVIDFVTFRENGTVQFIDAKGMETPEFKTKKRLVEALYPIEITLITKRS